ncbi:metallophosphoesterase [Bacteroides ovatus]|uniref:metallophosphoesterase n=1 Tax=Bacteroides ovatus TaxID=28116 RepID=UPI003144F8DF
MKTRFLRLFLSILVLVLISSGMSAETYHSGDKKKEQKEKKEQKDKLSGDGPYILYQPDGSACVISVSKKGKITDKTYATLPEDFSFRVTDHKGHYPFDVKLHPLKRPDWKYTCPEKVFVMSDPHGRLDCVISLLQGNGVINDKYQWSFGKNHLVIIGDVFDRGKDVLQIFWLFYKLEDEAAKAGGHVSLLLGNHEALVLSNDLRYTKDKYKQLAQKLEKEYPQLFGSDTELGRWLATRNTMQIIGTDLYVHAGLGKLFYEKDLSISTVNTEMSKALFMSKKERKALSSLTEFLYGNEGPIWYRGLVRTDEKYKPLENQGLQELLERYKVEHIIVGHTIFKDISTFYNGRVIGVNVDNKENREKKRGRAVLIEGSTYYVVGDAGIQRKLY